MSIHDALIGLLVMTPLFALFGLFVLILILRSKHNRAHPAGPEPQRGPWPPRLTTGPWHAQLASYFPPTYSHAMRAVVAALFVADLVFRAVGTSAPASWLYLLPLAPASFAIGHAWAFFLDFLRSRMNKANPADEAQPVAYYTPDMAPASYQPTFRTLSSLVRLAPFVIGILGVWLGVQIGGNPAPTWGKLIHAADLFGLVGFWAGCREILRGVTASRS